MSILQFGRIAKIFGGGELSDDEKHHLFDEALLMTLARATNSDANIEPVEIDAVQEIIKSETGNDISPADIRVAANSELFETTPLAKYLAKTVSKLDESDRIRLVKALAKVISSDELVRSKETAYFKMVVKALKVDSDDVRNLISGS